MIILKPMRWALLISLLLAGGISNSTAADGKVVKVLQQYLDKEGRHSLSPSLYERDAYQARLRRSTNEVTSVRLDIAWKVKGSDRSNLKLRAEVKGGKLDSKPLILEQPVTPDRWGDTWTALKMKKEDYKELGEVVAWRVTLWQGERMLGEQKSFLW
jgi:hypothetical protein